MDKKTMKAFVGGLKALKNNDRLSIACLLLADVDFKKVGDSAHLDTVADQLEEVHPNSKSLRYVARKFGMVEERLNERADDMDIEQRS